MSQNYQYYLGIYKNKEPFSYAPEVSVLQTCQNVYPEFFPAKFYTAPYKFETLGNPQDFSREMAPPGHYGSDEIDFSTFYGEKDERLSISMADDDIDLVPCNILLSWENIEDIPTIDRLEEIFKVLAKTFSADLGRVSNSNFAISNEIYDRVVDHNKYPKLMEWITWLHPAHTQNIGAEKIEALKDIVRVQPFMDGYLVTLTDEPYDDAIPEHRKIRIEVEGRLGLTAIYEANKAES